MRRIDRHSDLSSERKMNDMDDLLRRQLQIHACKIRMGIIEGVYNAKSGHPGGSLSIADVLTYLYFTRMHVYPDQPDLAERDRFVLSKGHTAPALYATLAERGFFPMEEMKTLRHIGAELQGHPCISIPGVDMSSGSLGQGISAAAGMALAGKHRGDNYRVYTILGDGEIEEGQVWEAAMFSAHYGLDNLTAIVDNNGLQIDGRIDQVMNPYPITDKLAAFGLHVIEIDGHDFRQMEQAFAEAKATKGVPTAIVMKTVKGKDVSYMENQAAWHGKAPNDEEYARGMADLAAVRERL